MLVGVLYWWFDKGALVIGVYGLRRCYFVVAQGCYRLVALSLLVCAM